MPKNLLGFALATAFALVVTAPAIEAQDAPLRVRGTVDKVEGDTYVIKARDGAELKVKLAPNGSVVGLVKATTADIKPGYFIGVTSLPETDGSWRATEVHIFPESMRGTGEGDRPWDTKPKSMMTNANVTEMVTKVNGPVVTMKYKEGEKKILIPADCEIVTYMPGDKSELKPGAKIMIPAAVKQPDGTYVTQRFNVGRGVTPAM